MMLITNGGIIFSTDYFFKLLSNSRRWYMKDTFKKCLKTPKQLYTIHIDYKNEVNIPIIYAFSRQIFFES